MSGYNIYFIENRTRHIASAAEATAQFAKCFSCGRSLQIIELCVLSYGERAPFSAVARTLKHKSPPPTTSSSSALSSVGGLWRINTYNLPRLVYFHTITFNVINSLHIICNLISLELSYILLNAQLSLPPPLTCLLIYITSLLAHN